MASRRHKRLTKQVRAIFNAGGYDNKEAEAEEEKVKITVS